VFDLQLLLLPAAILGPMVRSGTSFGNGTAGFFLAVGKGKTIGAAAAASTSFPEFRTLLSRQRAARRIAKDSHNCSRGSI